MSGMPEQISDKVYDTAVVGAGAAGLMTATQCARGGASTLLLDGRSKIGAKILMSGGTRCNVTNFQVAEKDYNSETPRAVRDVLRGFGSESAVSYFSDLGVELKLEKGGKYFPTTHSAQTVLDALIRGANEAGVTLVTDSKVTVIRRVKDKDSFEILTSNQRFLARTAVLTTGGLSYPSSGSDGSGYGLAQALGHSLVQTFPSLTPFLTNDNDFKALSGIALPARLTLKDEGGRKIEFTDSFLFTHFGFSGPAALNMSRHWKPGAVIRISFVPEESDERLIQELDMLRKHSPHQSIGNWLSDVLPERLALTLLHKSGISEDQPFHQLKKEERQRLLETLFHYPLPVAGVFGYAKAEVTAGGVNFDEVNSKTMESKLCRGLYFAGEILDVDGKIGGFNFQWAWSSGVVASRGILKALSL